MTSLIHIIRILYRIEVSVSGYVRMYLQWEYTRRVIISYWIYVYGVNLVTVDIAVTIHRSYIIIACSTMGRWITFGNLRKVVLRSSQVGSNRTLTLFLSLPPREGLSQVVTYVVTFIAIYLDHALNPHCVSLLRDYWETGQCRGP